MHLLGAASKGEDFRHQHPMIPKLLHLSSTMPQTQQQVRLQAAWHSLSLKLPDAHRTCGSRCMLGCRSALLICPLRCRPLLFCFVQLLFRRPLRAEAVI
jgi:hypothetical protein